jgi:hypothetical protein
MPEGKILGLFKTAHSSQKTFKEILELMPTLSLADRLLNLENDDSDDALDLSKIQGNVNDSHSGASSYQTVGPTLVLDSAAGKNAPDSAQLGPIMGEVDGDSLTKTGNYVFGVQGKDVVTGTNARAVKGGVLGVVGDGVTDTDGAVVALLDGDSGATTTPAAMFKAKKLNSTAGNNPDYGLDLKSAESGFQALVPKKADIRIADDVCLLHGAGAPTTAGTNFAGKGSLYVDITNGKLYINGGTSGSPSWKLVTSA